MDNYVSGWEELGVQRYYINRYQDPEYSWLEQQLYQATLLGQILGVNQHRKNGNAGYLAELLDRYNVQLKFSGHYHRNLGFDGYAGWYEPGSSARGDYLRLVVDPDEKSAEIYAYDGQAGDEERLINTVSLTKPEEIDKPAGLPAVNIRVKNNGGYNSRVTVSYNNKDEVTASQSSGTLNLGNSYIETIPATSSNISLQAFSHTGLLWESERRIFQLQDLREDTCIDIWGTALSPKWGIVSCKE